jgi:hypothetical protein
LINRSIRGHHLHPQFLQKGLPEGKEFIIHQGLGNADAHKAVLSYPVISMAMRHPRRQRGDSLLANPAKIPFPCDLKKISSNRAKGKVGRTKELLTPFLDKC